MKDTQLAAVMVKLLADQKASSTELHWVVSKASHLAVTKVSTMAAMMAVHWAESTASQLVGCLVCSTAVSRVLHWADYSGGRLAVQTAAWLATQLAETTAPKRVEWKALHWAEQKAGC